ncbi:MAG: L-lactate permease [Acidobacteriota bacterium]|nr:L-lactate permease [Acidobacteriota bacterium]
MNTTSSKPSATKPAPAAAPPKPNLLAAAIVVILGVAVSVFVLRLPSLPGAWQQNYNPLGHWLISALVAAIPVVVLLGSLALGHIKAHYAALAGLIAALLTSIIAFHMPARLACATAIYGAGYGLFPIGWIVLNVIFMYQLTVETGRFTVLQHSLTGITQDRRLQLLLIAFCFGAFFEGAAGFGTPVAVTAALLIGLGFRPLQASGLSLIANTAPVAFGALGTPIIALAKVTSISEVTLSAMTGRILTPFCIIVPFWLVWAFAGFGGMIEVWPAILVAGVSFAIPQLIISNVHGPWVVNVVAAVVSMLCLILFLLVWHPKKVWKFDGQEEEEQAAVARGEEKQTYSRKEITQAWIPWVILSVIVFVWGTQTGKLWMNTPEKVFPSLATMQTKPSAITNPSYPVRILHNMVERTQPVVLKNTKEPAVYNLNWLSATGTGIFIAAVLSGFIMGRGFFSILGTFGRTLVKVRFSLLTIAAMLGIGMLTRYSGLDATMGLAFARTGHLYPFFGTMLGWLGVALTGSDTSSNVLFGSLQKITAQQVNVSPVLMAAANTTGGVMGKMIDAQSIVVASTATQWYGHEGSILRYVFLHSLALASLVGILIFLMAYVYPFTQLVVH